MEVYLYLDYREDKDTGEIQFECPEVYATKEAAEQRYNNAVCEIQENIDDCEPHRSQANVLRFLYCNRFSGYI